MECENYPSIDIYTFFFQLSWGQVNRLHDVHLLNMTQSDNGTVLKSIHKQCPQRNLATKIF